MYKAAKRDKIKEIVILLDLFDGKLTLTDILNSDIALLNQMRDIKIEFINEQQKNNKQTLTVANPETFKK